MLEHYRRLTLRNIQRNPSEITLVRTTITIKPGGGQGKETTELVPQTMRIFLSSLDAQAQDVVAVGGRLQVQRWGLFATWDADIKKDDEFEHEGRNFRVRSVSPVSRAGARVAYHADLEEVR